jgi:PIN domain nuclease of toxin-antitoxin system
VAEGVTPDEVMARLGSIGLEIEPFDDRDASLVGLLRPMTKALGLSLADRACLALGMRLELPVLTADRALMKARVGVAVRAIR